MTDFERLAPSDRPGRALPSPDPSRGIWSRKKQGRGGRALLIGIGNDFAGDDAAGRLVARGLAGAGGFDVIESHGAAADLVTAFEGRGRVVVVDACLSGAKPGTLHRFDVHRDQMPGFLTSVSSHGIGVAEGVALARALDLLPGVCEIIAIEGKSFAQGAGIDPAVARAVAELIATLPGELA